jgi:hypothetical protein
VKTRCMRPGSRPCILSAARELANHGSFGGCLALAGRRAVGLHVDIYWPIEQMWMHAEIMDFDPHEGVHSVRYLDGQALDSPLLPMWKQRVRLSAGAPTTGHEAAAKPGGYGWYPGEQSLAREAAEQVDAEARARRMADMAKLVKECVEQDWVTHQALMNDIQKDKALRSKEMGSAQAEEMLRTLVHKLRRGNPSGSGGGSSSGQQQPQAAAAAAGGGGGCGTSTA